MWGYYVGDVTDNRWQTYRCAQVAFGDDYARCAGTYVKSVMNLLLAAAAVIVLVVMAALLFVIWRRATPSSQ